MKPVRFDAVPDISLILCTRNRARDLHATLASLATVRLPRDLLTELLVVDNGSVDDTAQVVGAFAPTVLRVRYVLETAPGQARARNRGLAETRARVIVFTDDDVRFTPDWLEGISRPILEGKADALTGAICIAAHLQREWMTPVFRAYFGATDTFAEEPEHMVGANMAFSRSVLSRVPAFDPDLGPGAIGFYDDTLFSHQVLKAGFRLRYAPAALVEHHFDPIRLSRRHLEKFACNVARSRAYVEYHWEHRRVERLLRKLRRSAMHRFIRGSEHRDRRRAPEGISTDDFARIFDMNYYLQHLLQLRTPPHYEQYGLLRRN